MRIDFGPVHHRRGILYVVNGKNYFDAAVRSAMQVARTNSELGIAIISDQEHSGSPFHYTASMPKGSHRRKQQYLALSPFEETLYLDSDTFVTTRLSDMFEVLKRFDVAGVQVRYREKPMRLRNFKAEIPAAFPQINTGVLLYKRNAAVFDLFNAWSECYESGGFKRDQIPFREVLWLSDVRFYTLAPEYNKRMIPLHGIGGEPPPKVLHLKLLNTQSRLLKFLLKLAIAPTMFRVRRHETKLAKVRNDAHALPLLGGLKSKDQVE
jgi:hypothetical protein